MVVQYPDTIIVTWEGEPVPLFVLDEQGNPTNIPTGDYLPGEDHSHTFKCRVETNLQSRKVIGSDGNLIDYGYDVFMPKTDVQIPAFEADYVLNGNLHGKIKRAHNGQLNSRLWL